MLSLHLSLFLSFSFSFHWFSVSIWAFWSSGFRFSHTLSCHIGRPQKCRIVESVRGSGIPHAEGKHCTGQEGTQRSKQYTYPPQRYHTPTSTIISLPLTLPILGPTTAPRQFTACIFRNYISCPQNKIIFIYTNKSHIPHTHHSIPAVFKSLIPQHPPYES